MGPLPLKLGVTSGGMYNETDRHRKRESEKERVVNRYRVRDSIRERAREADRRRIRTADTWAAFALRMWCRDRKCIALSIFTSLKKDKMCECSFQK